jgi:KaiC/GvpD/RAD55 family RecA-like ATPase
METHDNLLQTIEAGGHSAILERAVLRVIATPGKKGQTYCDTICYKDPVSGYFYKDFSGPSRNVLCMCLKEWRASCGDQYDVPGEPVIRLMIAKLVVEHPDLVTMGEAGDIVTEWNAVLLEDNPLLPVAMNEELVGTWMKRRRLERAVRDTHYKLTAGGGKLSASTIVERLHKSLELADLSGLNTNSSFVSIDDILNPKNNKIQSTTFYSTGVPVLDRMLGGGYARGYSYMHVTGTGGGKTVHATHTTVNMALRQDLKCLWVSTEEPENEVYYRLLANFTGVSHEEIREKLPKGELLLSPGVQARFDLAAKKMRENVLVKRWIGEEFNLVLDLKAEIAEFERKNGFPPHYIIFDWLGASTEELGSANGVRNSLKSKAYQMDQLAKQTSTTVLFYMQAGEQYKSERFINQSHVDECKGAAAKCAAVIGWSFLPNKGDGVQLAANGVHQDLQFMSVGKSRFGKGGFFQVRRNFAIQRYEFPK